MGVAARQDDVHRLRLLFERSDHLGRVEHAVADGVVDLVEDHQVPLAGADGLLGFRPGLLHQLDVFRVGLGAAHFDEAAAHLLHHEVGAKGLHRVQFAVVPGALEELQHQHLQAVAHGAQSGAHGCRGLALAGAGVHEDQALAGFAQVSVLCDTDVP